MNKEEFQLALRCALGKLPSYEVEQTITFYSEMIADRMEDGMTEYEAVAALGNPQAIAAQIIAETPAFPKAIAKANTGSKSLNIVLLAVLSPIWVPLALAFVAVVFAIYIAIWAVVVALWAVVITLLLCGLVGVFGLFWLTATGYPISGVWMLGCGLAGCGLGLLAWSGVLAASKGLVRLTHVFARKVKSLFVRLNKPGTDSTLPMPPHAAPTEPIQERQINHV
ncbi:MAG: DUF1700 domain-containing protein [Raoultibacter sp.]